MQFFTTLGLLHFTPERHHTILVSSNQFVITLDHHHFFKAVLHNTWSSSLYTREVSHGLGHVKPILHHIQDLSLLQTRAILHLGFIPSSNQFIIILDYHLFKPERHYIWASMLPRFFKLVHHIIWASSLLQANSS